MENPNILIAEDDALLQKLYERALSRNNWNCTSVQSGSDTIETLTTDDFDILLLDLHMPDIDGYGVLEHIQKNNISITVIVLTNMSEESDRKKCSSYGVKDFFVKSDMDLDNLSEMIKVYF